MRTQEESIKVPPELKRKLLFDMLRIRRVEETIAQRYAEQEMRCPVHLCIGQEAVAVGICSALEKTDYILSTHRAHGHYLAKGGDLRAMMAEIYGKATGCSSGKGRYARIYSHSGGQPSCRGWHRIRFFFEK
jgi:TPP-dependent pyruvate/acetoin dehydrogenase alpha subunit